MAQVLTSITPAQFQKFYGGLTDPVRDRTYAPRGEVRAYASGTIAAVAAGDNQAIRISTALPAGQSYYLADMALTISADSASDVLGNWSENLYGDWRSYAFGGSPGPTGIRTTLWIPGYRAVVVGPIERAQYNMIHPLSLIMSPSLPTGQVSLQIDAYNATAEGDAAAYMVFQRFLTFDPLQAAHWVANAPMPVR